MTPTPPNEKKCEFPQGKESYCPRCYFEDEITVLRPDCKHNKKPCCDKCADIHAANFAGDKSVGAYCPCHPIPQPQTEEKDFLAQKLSEFRAKFPSLEEDYDFFNTHPKPADIESFLSSALTSAIQEGENIAAIWCGAHAREVVKRIEKLVEGMKFHNNSTGWKSGGPNLVEIDTPTFNHALDCVLWLLAEESKGV